MTDDEINALCWPEMTYLEFAHALIEAVEAKYKPVAWMHGTVASTSIDYLRGLTNSEGPFERLYAIPKEETK